ncbi:37S ribosomal protein S24, mitochondrial [Sphaceloma murrayae]|uniref:37S ribosomal protein S24, mitochondrial n=1 Tax=Sphaceloma murrayae TaxID=2082308 RepID=A0A2K1R0M3_9PEZI|nr:37S ribosomal protein S24, mitochondrial [Sphaceloma murrayae]
MTVTGPFANYQALGPGILYHNTSSATSTGVPSTALSPSLIILCTWVSAPLRAVAKYTSYYEQTHPSSSILVLTSTVNDMVFGTDARQAARFAPARDVILSHASQPSGVLLHVFSNGGCQTAGRLLVSLPKEIRKSLLRAVVFDSCPGKGTFGRSARAMMASLPRTWFFRVFGMPIVMVLLLMVMLLDEVFGVDNVVTVARGRMGVGDVIPRRVPRLYLYGRRDRMVKWEDVEDHAKTARRQGCERVQEVIFDDGGHCALIVADSREYWGAVDRITEVREG